MQILSFVIDLNLTFAIDLSLAVFLWLVQCIIYPSFRYISADIFEKWHAGYRRRVSWIIGPILLLQIFLVGIEAIQEPSRYSLIRLGLVAVSWLITVCVSVPLHRRIKRGEQREQSIERLIHSNWLRTLTWSSLLLSHFLPW